jgi:hypothetical protein
MGVLTLVNPMPSRLVTISALVPMLMTAGAESVAAQQQNNARCRAVLLDREFITSNDSVADPCFVLANAIVTDLSAKAWLEQRDMQSSGSGSAAPAGTPAQAGAVPTIQPTPLASATLAAVAQDSGANVITAVSINPAMLFSSTTDPDEVARLSRLLDLTVFFPVDRLDSDGDGRLDYGGARIRVNLTASSQASALQRNVRQRLTAIVRNELLMANAVADVLRTAPDPQACAVDLTREEAAAADILATCGADVSRHVDDAAHAALRRAAAAAREEADARYVGLDLRFDSGDPSLGRIRNAAATALQGGVGFGRRFNPVAIGASAGIRGRLGVRYVTMRDTTLSDWQLDGGLALETARLMESQRLELSAGFEFRYSGNREASDILRTRYAEFRAGVVVPIAGSTGIAMSMSVPLMGDVSPVLSLSGNWQQLLAARIPRR